MPNHFDFLVALDDHIRAGNLGYIMQGHEMFGISQQAGLTGAGDESPGQWIGLLARDGYIAHSAPGFGDNRPVPYGAYTSSDLARFNEYRVTPTGRSEADRIRRQRRDELTDGALGSAGPDLLRAVVDDRHRTAITSSFVALRTALDGERPVAAIGAAKDLVEVACKITIERTGQQPGSRATLPALYKQAIDAAARTDPASDLGRSLTTLVQRLAELRNAAGAGHGQSTPPEVTARDARLAAAAACGVALHLLGPSG